MKKSLLTFLFLFSIIVAKAQVTAEPPFICIFPVLPSFPGGEKAFEAFVKSNIHYPDSAKARGIEGTVYIQYTIDSSGKLFDFVERKGIPGYPEFTAEAIRVLKLSPNWNMKGVNMESPYIYTKPFRFILVSDDDNVNPDSASQKCGIQIPEAALGNIKTFTEVMPQFPGDSMLAYLMHRVRYPAHTDQPFCSETLYVQFLVDTTGRVINVELKKALPPECHALAGQVLNVFCKMPAWKPGESNGIPVNVKMIVPVRIETGR